MITMKKLLHEIFNNYRELSRETDKQQKQVSVDMEKMKRDHDKIKQENDN